MDQFTWVYGAIGAIGVLGMAATKFLFDRINDSEKTLWGGIREVEDKIDVHEKKTGERAIENERRFALKDDLIIIKEHMDKRFDQLGSMILQLVKGGHQ